MDSLGKKFVEGLQVLCVVVIVVYCMDVRADVVKADVPANTVDISIVCPSGPPSKLASNSWQCGSGPPPPQCPSPPGVGPCGEIKCPAPDPLQPSNTTVISMDWANPQRMLTGYFPQNDVVVVKFTTGSTPSTINLLKIAGAEYQGPPTQRIAALSDVACDFKGLPYFGAVITNQTSLTVNFTVDNPNNYGYYPILHTNTTYYFNVKNSPLQCNPAPPYTSCSMAFDLVKYNNP